MLVVDASCLYEVGRRHASHRGDPRAPNHAAPHLVDAEGLGVVRRHHLAGLLDATAAAQAVDDLAERYSHRPLLARAWELRATVRSGTRCTSRSPKRWLRRS